MKPEICITFYGEGHPARFSARSPSAGEWLQKRLHDVAGRHWVNRSAAVVGWDDAGPLMVDIAVAGFSVRKRTSHAKRKARRPYIDPLPDEWEVRWTKAEGEEYQWFQDAIAEAVGTLLYEVNEAAKAEAMGPDLEPGDGTYH